MHHAKFQAIVYQRTHRGPSAKYPPAANDLWASSLVNVYNLHARVPRNRDQHDTPSTWAGSVKKQPQVPPFLYHCSVRPLHAPTGAEMAMFDTPSARSSARSSISLVTFDSNVSRRPPYHRHCTHLSYRNRSPWDKSQWRRWTITACSFVPSSRRVKRPS